MGGPVHSRSRSGNWQGHHQKRPRQDAGGSKRKTEKSHRGKRRHRLRQGKSLHRGKLAGGLDGKLRQSETQTVHVQDLARLSEKPHQAADRQCSTGRPHFSGLAAILQAPAGRWAGRPHRGEKERTADGRGGTQSVTTRKLARPSSKTSSARRRPRSRKS